MRNVTAGSQSGVELNGNERTFAGITRTRSGRRLFAVFLGFALMVGLATVAMAGSGDVQEAGQVA